VTGHRPARDYFGQRQFGRPVQAVNPAPLTREERRQAATAFGHRMLHMAEMLMMPSQRDAERFAEMMEDLALDYAHGYVKEDRHNQLASEAAELLPVGKSTAVRFVVNTRRELLRLLPSAAPKEEGEDA
jgi:hypothetical protein